MISITNHTLAAYLWRDTMKAKDDDKYIWTAKVGEKGQIVIPKEARDIFEISPGDTLLLLGDKKQGIAIVKNSHLLDFAKAILKVQEDGDES